MSYKKHAISTGEIHIRAQEEHDGYYHLYSIQLGYLDEYTMPNKPKIKRFRKLHVGKKMAKKFLKAYIKNLKDELKTIDE